MFFEGMTVVTGTDLSLEMIVEIDTGLSQG